MNNLQREIRKSLKKLYEMKAYLTKEIEKMPHGEIRVNHPKNICERYYRVEHDDNGKRARDKYLSKKRDKIIIGKLAQKEYDEKLLRSIIREIVMLERFAKEYDDSDKEEVFANERDELKEYINPYYKSTKELYDEFSSEEFEPNTSHPEHLKFETDNDEKVRSKSELMIANQLYRHGDKLCYKYEKPLALTSGEIVHPDFTIMRKDDGKIFYWEHYGRMDKSNYVDELVWKMDQYTKMGIWPGENLIMTFETEAFPLSLQKIRRTIDKYLFE